MDAERRAFWILRAVPVTLARLMAQKALFWAAFLCALALGTYAALLGAGAAAIDAEALGRGLLVALGATGVSFLAVGLACGAADLSHEGKSAVGFGTVYLHMLVAGLFNVVLLASGLEAARALLLFAGAAAFAFATGLDRAADAFDAEALARRRVSAGAGAVLVVILALGRRAGEGAAAAAAGPEVAAAAGVAWPALVAVGAAFYLVARGARRGRAGLGRALGVGLGFAAAGFAAARAASGPAAAGLALAGAAVGALAEELVLRGILQEGLEADGAGARRRRGRAFVVSALFGLLVAPGTPAPTTLVAALAPAAARALGGRLPAALLARAGIVAGTGIE
jgi:hypothetical protein